MHEWRVAAYEMRYQQETCFSPIQENPSDKTSSDSKDTAQE